MDAIVKARQAAGEPGEKVKDRLRRIFEKVLMPKKDFIEESAMVMGKLDEALDGCCHGKYESWLKGAKGSYKFEGGIYISPKMKRLSLRIADGTGAMDFSEIDPSSPMDEIDKLAAAVVSYGFANEAVFNGIEDLFSTVVLDLKAHMNKVEDDMDALIGGKRDMSSLMKCEVIARENPPVPANIIPSCIEALKPLEERKGDLVETLCLLEKFEHTFGSTVERLDIAEYRTRDGLDFEMLFPAHDVYLSLMVEKTAGDGCRFILNSNYDNLHPELEWEEKCPTIDELASKLMKALNLDKIQILHLPEYLTKLVETALKGFETIDERMERHIASYEGNI